MRLYLIATGAVLTLSGAAYAEPAQHDALKAPAQQRPAEVVLASADGVHAAPTPGAQPAPPPLKRPAPRVTTCRCGDPQPDPGPQEQ